MTPEPLARLIDAHQLPSSDGDKDQRGTVVLIAGSPSCPGAALLSGVAALRAGAGRVQIVTALEVVTAVGIHVPESLALAYDDGGLSDRVRDVLGAADAVCIGPGLDERADDLTAAALEVIPRGVPVLLDAHSLPSAVAASELGQRFVVAPNVREAEKLLQRAGAGGSGSSEVDIRAMAAALTSALRAPVAVRGETTVLADGEAAWWTQGATGLGTAGSGDVLAGITAGMLARGLGDAVALGWGVAVHAMAGRLLGQGRTNPGFLARELLDVVPNAIAALSP